MKAALLFAFALALHTAVATDGWEWEGSSAPTTQRALFEGGSNSAPSDDGDDNSDYCSGDGDDTCDDDPSSDLPKVHMVYLKHNLDASTFPKYGTKELEKFEPASSNGWSLWLLVQVEIFVVVVLIIIYSINIIRKRVEKTVPKVTEKGIWSTTMDV